MKTLKEQISERLLVEGKNDFEKLCKSLPDGAWNPWKVLRHIDDDADIDELVSNAETEASDMWDDDMEGQFKKLFKSPKYDKLVQACREWDDPRKEYILALLNEFENLM